ncbi:hypothetical protein F5Y00DRAFT_224520 [Daldinia vernicosa]|uniref:uncharacterized protein n=1 Tax=Daldinia vernicosa TaxID=114800 RepID=UPI002007FDB0|nr:uncharacterized protein F5Y00DRAFT_224520 [Daldinia vernicosa]KAI0853369.1 hypothetical protein F5Y00DRAFT_224520 [Daldinia vernicosa]
MNLSTRQSRPAPAQTSQTYSPERRDTPSSHTHPPSPSTVGSFGQEARRCEATQDQTRLPCEATHYLLPTDIANACEGWEREKINN